MGRSGVKPAVRLMTVVLSNGATLRMPSAAGRTKPYIATQDLFQHNVWTVKAKGAEAAAAGRVRQVDFSDFYKRFGLGDDDAGDAPGGGGGGGGAAQKR
ncbi:hypothetical protein Rsub_12868 [Raphidocelis subcapitata]|uniref:Uncharacterized protein n=1 Tax=Raphidocelis subcapitata TaxID=307507 RepID=A0A2V0PLU7_9CHLO|nr:hypothetical protein Rsub_12868 [Raphidocelis subcapitata]|eukprot:GBG00043.1 hypothetical protein Rsub_12868 [Raphidocelis subcapitata]